MNINRGSLALRQLMRLAWWFGIYPGLGFGWTQSPQNPYRTWPHGPPASADYFPIAVWLQSPAKAEQYRQAGINVYVALWRGPTEEQLAQLHRAGMKLICAQNSVGLAHRDDPTIVGWMHGDEPDNAQSLGQGQGYGPPILPTTIQADYARLRAADPTRPVMLNLGQGVAWDNWHGRGVRSRHPEDYPEYIQGGDIISFDIYPVVHDNPEVRSNLWFVAKGVERLRQWTAGRKIVWNCIECTRISNPDTKPNPAQVRSEVWMSLIHGSQGLIYFVHQFKPRFDELALLSDPEMLEAVTALNHQIQELAPVLNSPTLTNAATAVTTPPETPVAWMVKRRQGATYLFAVAMRNAATTAEFHLRNVPRKAKAQVLGEGRTLDLEGGVLKDEFVGWQVHLYRITR